MRWRYFCDLPVPGQMTEFVVPSFRVSLFLYWSITTHLSRSGNTIGASFLSAWVRVLMVTTFFP